MTKELFTFDHATNEWVHTPTGRRVPFVAGGAGDDVITVPADPKPAEQAPETPPAQPASPNSRLFTEEEVEAIRRQEKDKVYSKIDKMQQQLDAFNQEREAAARAAEEARQREEEERRAREEEEMTAKELLTKKEDEWKSQFNTAQQEWEQKFMALQQESEAQKALLEKERQFQALESYKSRRLAEESDNLMPELLDFIQGNSEEEIENAIQAVAARTSAIMASMQEALPAQPERPRGVPATGSTPSGPLENSTEHQTFTVSDIASMDMSTFAANRERLLAAASNMRRG